MQNASKLGLGLLVAVLVLATTEGVFRMALGKPSPELAATLPDGNGPLIRRSNNSIAPTYQNTRKQPAVAPKQPSDPPRIVWLGGSSIHGGSHDISIQEEAPGRIGELLGIESLNFAGIGMDTISIGSVLNDVLSLKPDVLVLYTGHNELGNAVFTGRYGDPTTASIAKVRAFLGASRLFQTLEMVIRGREILTLPSEMSEDQYTVDDSTRAEIYWRFEERLRHIIAEANHQGVKVIVSTLMSNPVAPSMEFSCPEAVRRAGYRGTRPEPLPVAQLAEPDIAAAEKLSPQCRDLRWIRARRSGDKAALDHLRDTDPLPVRADKGVNEIIRRVAAETQVQLVDVDEMAREAGNGLEPSAWFLDPMHLTVDGHDALARMVAQSVAPLLRLSPPSLAPAPTTERDLAGCGGEGCRERKAFRPELDLDFGQFNQ